MKSNDHQSGSDQIFLRQRQLQHESTQEIKSYNFNYQRKTIRRDNLQDNQILSTIEVTDNNFPVIRLNTINKQQYNQLRPSVKIEKQKFSIIHKNQQNSNLQQKIIAKPPLPKSTRPTKKNQFTQLKDEQKSKYNKPTSTSKSKIQKLRDLSKNKYLNSLARLQYEDRQIEIYTKISAQSKKSITNKIKAKNQLAQFDDQDQEDNDINDLIEFKMGKSGPNGSYTYYQADPTQQKQLHKSMKIEDIIREITNEKQKKQTTLIEQKQQEKKKKQKAFYCNKCDKLMPYNNYKDTHKQKCTFVFSEDPVKMRKQIIEKLENILKILNKLDENQSMKILKNCLSDSIISYLKIESSLTQIQNLKQQNSHLFETLKKRVIFLLTQRMSCNLLCSKSKMKYVE